jgi:hypothetical protein
MAGVVARQVREYKKRPLVTFDWTGVRSYHCLLAVAWIRGRAAPLFWASCPQWKLTRSQNSLDEGLLRLLRTLIPASVEMVILADHGFGRPVWVAVCQELGFRDLVRIEPAVRVSGAGLRGSGEATQRS